MIINIIIRSSIQESVNIQLMIEIFVIDQRSSKTNCTNSMSPNTAMLTLKDFET